MYKITNKTFQPIRIIFNEKSYRMGSRKYKSNIIFVETLNAQIKNLQKRGFIKVRKMH